MADIIPFKAIRPPRDKAYLVSSLPYYAYTKEVLKAKLISNPYTFLHIINPEFSSKQKTKPNSIERFQLVKNKFDEFYQKGYFIKDNEEAFYLYRQTTPQNQYLGLIAGISVDEYLEGKIKIHEHTLTKREETFKTYLDVCKFNAEPVLLMHKRNAGLKAIFRKYTKKQPEYEFSTTHFIKHELWLIKKPKDIAKIKEHFKTIQNVYIADGHHRTASSVLYAQSKRKALGNYDKNANFNYFLGYFIAENDIKIFPFNRIVQIPKKLTSKEILDRISHHFNVHKVDSGFNPLKKHEIAMLLEGNWYKLTPLNKLLKTKKVADKLDVALINNYLLTPIFNIKDFKKDKKVQYKEGSKGFQTVEKAINNDPRKIGFVFYEVTPKDLKKVADNNETMPPKSTWIEPKLRSGLTIFDLND
ncbi:MAG: DUF1015 domain-containing protein [Vicingaceae bacterium]